MTRLKIDRKYCIRHKAAYKCAIGKALEVLASGGILRFKDSRSKRMLKFLKPKPTYSVCGYGICYVKFVSLIYKKYDVLVASPCVIQHCVDVLDRVDRRIIHMFPCRGGLKSKEVNECEKAKKALRELFNYDRFGEGKRLVVRCDPMAGLYFSWESMPKRNWSAWHFIRALNAGTCSYCNTEGVFSLLLNSKMPGTPETVVEGGDTRRSPLDHFFGYSKYPCFGLSLFNLVPSCTRCNTNMKGARKQCLKRFIHPYLESFDDGARFYVLYEHYSSIAFPEERDVCVVVRPPTGNEDRELVNRAIESAKFFHLEEVYSQTYKREVVDIIRRIVSMPEAYWDDMKCRFPGIDGSIVNRILLGCSIDRSVINSERLSKLACDLWEQLHVGVLPEEFVWAVNAKSLGEYP